MQLAGQNKVASLSLAGWSVVQLAWATVAGVSAMQGDGSGRMHNREDWERESYLERERGQRHDTERQRRSNPNMVPNSVIAVDRRVTIATSRPLPPP